jgi:hypothetical protein
MKRILTFLALAALCCGDVRAVETKPLRVYVLAGQSNMQGHAMIGVLGVGGPTAAYRPEQQRSKATHQHFRDAMVAPAQLPEFKGNVATMLAEQYWDPELTAAKARENQIKQCAKQLAAESRLPPGDEKTALKKMLAEGLTERERLVIETGISNLEFHDLGSAKFLGGVGKGLAEAMAELRKIK